MFFALLLGESVLVISSFLLLPSCPNETTWLARSVAQQTHCVTGVGEIDERAWLVCLYRLHIFTPDVPEIIELTFIYSIVADEDYGV